MLKCRHACLLAFTAICAPAGARADQLYDFTLLNPATGDVLSLTLPTTATIYGDPATGGAYFDTTLYQNGSVLQYYTNVFFGSSYNNLPGASINLYYQPGEAGDPAPGENAFVAGGYYGQTFDTVQQLNGMYEPATVSFTPGTYVALPYAPLPDAPPGYFQLNDTLTITEEVASTPEPPSILLLATGVFGAAVMALRRRFRQA